MRVYAYKQKRIFKRFLNLRDESRKLVQKASNLSDFDSLINLTYTYPDFQPAQKSSEIKKIMDLASSPKVKTICEIGTYKGGSLFLLAQAAASDTLLISVDIEYKDGRRRIYSKFAKPGQHIKCIKGDTHELSTIERIRRILRGRKIDLLFIDGDHSFFGVMNDYIRFSPLVSEGGVIVFHDVQMDSKMRVGVKSESDVGGVPIFWDAIKRSGERTDEYIDSPDQDGFGIGILVKN